MSDMFDIFDSQEYFLDVFRKRYFSSLLSLFSGIFPKYIVRFGILMRDLLAKTHTLRYPKSYMIIIIRLLVIV